MLKWFKRRNYRSNSSIRSNEEWVSCLSDKPDEQAIQDLRDILVRGLKPALHSYVDRERDQFVEDVAQDALLKILDHVHTFRGESLFLSWAMKIAIREALTELRRKKWNDLSLQDLTNHRSDDESTASDSMYMASPEPEPDQATHQSMILSKVMQMIESELSDKQKLAIRGIMIEGISMSVMAEKMGSNRNALYKLIHDARVKLKSKLAEEGLDPDQFLNDL